MQPILDVVLYTVKLTGAIGAQVNMILRVTCLLVGIYKIKKILTIFCLDHSEPLWVTAILPVTKTS